MILLESSINQIDKEKFLPVTFLEGFSSYAIPVPTLYAIRFLCGELESTLVTLLQSPELQELLSTREEEKIEIHEHLQRSLKLFEDFIMMSLRK